MSKDNNTFKELYDKLNPAQQKAVEAIDGPVMVVAGPGTGKTRVLAMRIANIFKKTDTEKNSVLCLTFTNAGVHAMREKLLEIMGADGGKVVVATFHSFTKTLIDKFYQFLDFDQLPEILDDAESIALVDEILEEGEWKYIRPRSDSSKYFSDLKSLISLLKRENILPNDFLGMVEAEIENLQNDPENISSRGARKGELKKEIENKIESLSRTKEVVKFYEEYELLKKERSLMDYDDVLKYAVELVKNSDEARAFIQENYQYVLVDEHQDSSGVQNVFLESAWDKTEKPNIFVVGDDRQLIYGFGGASLEQFQRFETMFGKAQKISLVENYRSTQTILDAADALLKDSSFSKDKLHSNSSAKEEKILIQECDYPRDEIIVAGMAIKKHLDAGVPANECAILVPKNYQAREAVAILRDMDIPVAVSGTVSFFAQPETMTIKHILSVLADPYEGEAVGELLLDPVMGVSVLAAHQFLRTNLKKINLETIINYAHSFLPTDPIARLGIQLEEWLKNSQELGLYSLIQKIGEDLFFENPKDHDLLIRHVEIVRTYLHLITSFVSKNPHLKLSEFVASLSRLEHYGHEIPLAVLDGRSGVNVLTLHGSKGLEFDFVHVAHLDEASLMKGRRNAFALPERVEFLIQAKDEQVARRELYVAITRARKQCTISYPRHSYSGGDLESAKILADLPEALVEKQDIEKSEDEIKKENPLIFVSRSKNQHKVNIDDLKEITAREYSNINVTVTLLNNFFECPWKWYFRNLLQLPEVKTESLIAGTVVHAGVEYLIKNKLEGNFEKLDAVLLSAIEKENVSDKNLTKRILREAKSILNNFEKNYLPQISDNAQSERSISYHDKRWSDLKFYGKIDLTESENEGFVQVTDFKTGSGKTKSMIEKRDEEGRLSSYVRQLAMYKYLIESSEKNLEVSFAKLIFLEEDSKSKDAVYAAQISNEETELLYKDFEDYRELLKSGDWVNRKCLAKTYGAGSECEYCTKAKQLYQ